MNTIKILLLSSSDYEFTDDRSKRLVEGTTLWVMPLNSDDKYTNGNKPVKYSLDTSFQPLFNSIELPAFADMTFEFDLSRNRVNPKSFDNFELFEVGEFIE